MFVPMNAGVDQMMMSGAEFVVGDTFVLNHMFWGLLNLEQLLEVNNITSWSGETFTVRSDRNRRRSEVFVSIGNGYSRSFLVTSSGSLHSQRNGLTAVCHAIDRPLLPEPTPVDPTAPTGPGGGGGAGVDTDSTNSNSKAETESYTDLIVVGSIVLVLLMVAICLAFGMIIRPLRNDNSSNFSSGLYTPAYSYGVMNTNYGLVHPQDASPWQDVPASPMGEPEDEFEATASYLASALQLGHGDAAATPTNRPGLLPDDYLLLSPENPYVGHSGFSPPRMPSWTAADDGSRPPTHRSQPW